MSLKEIYDNFCAFGSGQAGSAEMDNAKFAKFAKDTKILDKKLTKTDVDLIFSKIKQAGARKIVYSEFEQKALPLFAEKKGMTIEELAALIVKNGGPVSNSTKADKGGVLDKLTDTSLYTGAHKERFDESGHGLGAAGRVQNTAGVSDLSQITGKIGSGGGAGAPQHREVPTDVKVESHEKKEKKEEKRVSKPIADTEVSGSAGGDLKGIFNSFCAFGSGQGGAAEMDNAKFAKFAKDAKLIDKKLTPTDVDLIFSKIKQAGARKIGYSEFESKALPLLAEKKGITVGEITSILMGMNGPVSHSTKADSGGILDKLTDTSLYTGAHKERFDENGNGLGAAGRVQNTSGVSDLSQITGKIGSGGGAGAPQHREVPTDVVREEPKEPKEPKHKKHDSSSSDSDKEDKPKASKAKVENSAPASSLKDLFNTFCSFGSGQGGAVEMDNAKFAKFAKDTKIIDKKLTKTDVDLIFSKVKQAGARKIVYSEFEAKAMPLLAEKKGISVDELTNIMLKHGGPVSNSTKADKGGVLDKLTDASLYTGAHKERFDESGHGLGAAGRVQNTAGVSDLSQITRN